MENVWVLVEQNISATLWVCKAFLLQCEYSPGGYFIQTIEKGHFVQVLTSTSRLPVNNCPQWASLLFLWSLWRGCFRNLPSKETCGWDWHSQIEAQLSMIWGQELFCSQESFQPFKSSVPLPWLYIVTKQVIAGP